MEQIVFPVPSICEFLTKESKLRIYYTTERDEQGSKINDFFLKSEDLFNEMNWQKKLRGRLLLPVWWCGALPAERWDQVCRVGFGSRWFPSVAATLIIDWKSLLLYMVAICNNEVKLNARAIWTTWRDLGERGKRDQRSSFLRSNRKEQSCGGYLRHSLNEKEGIWWQGELERTQLKKAMICFPSLCWIH